MLVRNPCIIALRFLTLSLLFSLPRSLYLWKDILNPRQERMLSVHSFSDKQ